jgi:hypothetical protein
MQIEESVTCKTYFKTPLNSDVTIESATFNAHFFSGKNEEKMSGSGCLNNNVIQLLNNVFTGAQSRV